VYCPTKDSSNGFPRSGWWLGCHLQGLCPRISQKMGNFDKAKKVLRSCKKPAKVKYRFLKRNRSILHKITNCPIAKGAIPPDLFDGINWVLVEAAKMQTIALDIRTLSFITTSIALLFSIGLFAFGFQQKKFLGFTYFGAAAGFYTVGFLLLGYRDFLPDFVTIVVANMLLIVGLTLYLEGIRRFLQIGAELHPLSIAAIVVGLFIFLFFTYWYPSVNTRVIGIAGIYTVVSGYCGYLLVDNSRKKFWKLPDLATGTIFFYFSLFHLFRMLWTFQESPIQSFMSAGTVHALSFISVILFVAGSTFGFIWMVSKRLEFELVELASLDPLTKVLNRRGVDNMAAREFAKFDREKGSLSIALMDVDELKTLNDTHGHNFGDELLFSLAQLIQKNLRAYDILGRFGGDEFIFILPDTAADAAAAIIDRLRRLIEEQEFLIKNISVKITASFGIAGATAELNSLDRVTPLADKALYRSKNEGRNRVTVHHP
jgi:diguanylate cyclase (GGDEF)-like protein